MIGELISKHHKLSGNEFANTLIKEAEVQNC
jgi:hypothetical protein